MRGFDEEDFREVGRIIVDALDPAADLESLIPRVDAVCARRPLYPGFRGFTSYLA
jgi:glycine hydroxymethyltransferase